MAATRRVKEGFRGQRLVVLPAAVRDRVQRHPLLRGLLVTDAGIFPHASGHYIERPAGAPTTLVMLCLAGQGWVRTEAQTFQIEPGALVWLCSHLPHAYGADDGNPWTIEWVHLMGDEAGAWRELLGFPAAGGVLRLSLPLAGALNLGWAWAKLDQGYSVANLTAASGVLRAAFSLVAQKRATRDGRQSAHERVAGSLDWMKANLSAPVRLPELAWLAGLSVPHYGAIFRKMTGFSPVDWFNRLRIQRACEILDTTGATVAEIGRQVGFVDPYYFTRCFRKIVGLPPRQYRRVPKG